MAKNVIKELIIILLLCLAIILILGVLLYEYAPMSKTVPNPVAYTTPEEVEQELIDSEEEVVGSFDTSNDSLGVDSTDLNNYTRIQDYKPGKANPFSSYESSSTGGNTTSSNSSSGTTSSSSNNNTTSNNTSSGNNSNSNTSDETTTSGGHFFQDKGTK